MSKQGSIAIFIICLISSTLSSELGLGIKGIDFSTFDRNHFSLYISGNIQFSYSDLKHYYQNPLSLNLDFSWFKFENSNLRLRLMTGLFISQYISYEKATRAFAYEIRAYGLDVLSISAKLDISEKTGVFFYTNLLIVDDIFCLVQTEYKIGLWTGSNNLGIYIKF